MITKTMADCVIKMYKLFIYNMISVNSLIDNYLILSAKSATWFWYIVDQAVGSTNIDMIHSYCIIYKVRRCIYFRSFCILQK